MDQNQWQWIKEKYRENRIKFDQLKKEVLDALNSTKLRILKRTNKIKASIQTRKLLNDFYEYEDLYSFDEFDQNKNICNQIDWNVRNKNSTIYILKTYQLFDKIFC